jgi:hypothetical protein
LLLDASKFLTTFIATSLLASSAPAAIRRSDFCVVSENGSKRIIVVDQDSNPDEAASSAAEERWCSETCSRVCSAVPFSPSICEASPDESIDLNRANGQYFCETAEGDSAIPAVVVATVDARATHGQMTAPPEIIKAANNLLSNAGCPVQIELAGQVGALPTQVGELELSSAENVDIVAQYPGALKLVDKIAFCRPHFRTDLIQADGEELIGECTVPARYSVLVSNVGSYQTRALLFLRGLAHLAGVSEDTSEGAKYSLADPDLLIPKSALVDGDYSAFHVSSYQCALLARLSKQSMSLFGTSGN